jgi:hypothetical protein
MKSMHVRDFLRGAYKTIVEATVITRHGRPLGTWFPWGADWPTKSEGESKNSSR